MNFYYFFATYLHSFQDCMEIMTKNFKKHGGQLRQFIVDDKGTKEMFFILCCTNKICAVLILRVECLRLYFFL